LGAARHLEAHVRSAGIEVARQPATDRQHHREGAPRGQRRKRGEKAQAIGISRGGRSTKIHACVDSKGRPLNFVITGGEVHDSQPVPELLDTPRSALAVTADKAYDSKTVRQHIRDDGALPVIPSRDNARKKAYCPKRIYRRRHKIENFFCRIKDWRRIATRYDKLARNFLAASQLVGALYWSGCESRP
jgi:transposase